jgi:hypothetical protein
MLMAVEPLEGKEGEILQVNDVVARGWWGKVNRWFVLKPVKSKFF